MKQQNTIEHDKLILSHINVYDCSICSSGQTLIQFLGNIVYKNPLGPCRNSLMFWDIKVTRNMPLAIIYAMEFGCLKDTVVLDNYPFKG